PLAKEVIAKAYHSLVRTYHPDKVHLHHLPAAKSAFILGVVRRAADILLNDGARAEWDRQWLSGDWANNQQIEMAQSINRMLRDSATADVEKWDFWDDIAEWNLDTIKHQWGRKERVGQGGWWEIAMVGGWWMLWWWDRVSRGLQRGWRHCTGNWA
ncbi:MAG: hypothetical protein Q9177_001919, partial [Variospora cf. flavescens]